MATEALTAGLDAIDDCQDVRETPPAGSPPPAARPQPAMRNSGGLHMQASP